MIKRIEKVAMAVSILVVFLSTYGQKLDAQVLSHKKDVFIKIFLPQPSQSLLESQNWEIVVVNSSQRELVAQIEGKLIYVTRNVVFLHFVTEPIKFPKGKTSLTGKDMQEKSKHIEMSEILREILRDKKELLPGLYLVQVALVEPSTGRLLNADYTLFSPTSLDRPKLLLPENRDSVYWRPIFTWAYPLLPEVKAGDAYVTFEVELIEVKKGQTPLRAAEINVPFWRVKELRTNVFPLPDSVVERMHTGQYVWRVVMNVHYKDRNLVKLLSSEPFTFYFLKSKKF